MRWILMQRQPQLYIRNNKNDRQIKKMRRTASHFTLATIRTFVKQIKNAVDSDAADSRNFTFATIRTIVK
jgi:ribosomal protein S20